ncbi:MAG: hypothetical protein D6675_14310 [Gemmatimonadetes bacterium]|nr:MAG: hypothetical protein D6675_14310 [Gemmatimonadota bacterium]
MKLKHHSNHHDPFVNAKTSAITRICELPVGSFSTQIQTYRKNRPLKPLEFMHRRCPRAKINLKTKTA